MKYAHLNKKRFKVYWDKNSVVCGMIDLVVYLMERDSVSEGELAQRMKISRKRLESTLLVGDRGVTVSTLSHALHALGYRLVLSAELLGDRS